MKFGKTFETHLTIEWRQQYMRYTDLKTLIRRGVDGAPTESETTPDQFLEYYASFEEHFFAECHHELTRVNNFFLEKMAEARRKHGTLKLQLLATAHATGHVSRSHTRSQNQSRSHSQLPSPRASVVSMPSTSSNRKLMTQRQLRSAYTEFYLTLVLLQNFQSLNETGFRKICKKYDKYLKSNHGALWLERHLTYIAFVDRRPLQQMTIEVEELYTHYLAAGDRAKAMTKLRVPPLGEPTPPPMVFRAGLALGMFIMLALAALFSYLRRPPITDNIEAFMRLYRGPFTWVIFNFFMAANVAGWQRAGVNHVLIFEIDPRSHLQPATFLEIACTFGMLWTLSMLGFLFHDLINVTDPFVFPLALTLIMITLLINPLPIMNWPARWWTMRLVGRVITAPLHYVGFADFWMGDQMNSLVTCMADYYYIVRFYAVCWLRYSNVNSCFDEDMFVPISRCLPAWFRFAQCLRRFSDSGSKSLSYLLNAGKYSTTFFVVFFSTMRGRTDVSCRWLCEYVLQSLHVVLHHQLHRVERVQLSVGCVQGLWHLSDLAGRAFVPPGEARLSAVLLLLCHPRESRAASLLGHRVRCALPQADYALQYQNLRQHPGDNASLHLELHSAGERASEQLRTLSSHARHSPGCPQSDAGTHAGAYDDGPRAEAR